MSILQTEPLSQRTTVFLDELPWDMRSKNTDWRYVRFALPQLADFEPSLHLVMQTSPWITMRENIKILRAALGRRVGFPLSNERLLTSKLSEADLKQSEAEVVFSHRAFPLNAGRVPVIWQNAMLDPAMHMHSGMTQRDIDAEIATKRPFYQRAAALQVSTAAEVTRLRETFPEIADKFVAVPFFTPHAQSCPVELVERHLNDTTIRILFVANQPKLKRLDVLLGAYAKLSRHADFRVELVIVSNFHGPAVELPDDPNTTVIRGVNHHRVMEEMRRAHIFVNVSHFESYGLVFHEAMSQGLACIAPDWEVQRELFDYGNAGRLLSPKDGDMLAVLEELVYQPALRYSLGLAAWNRFAEKYAPAVVARQYAELFHRVARPTPGGLDRIGLSPQSSHQRYKLPWPKA